MTCRLKGTSFPKRCASTALLLAFLFGAAAAQEKSVAPGLNEFWEKPDMEKAAVILEQDHPTIFKYRHAIVAVLNLEPGSDVADIGAGSGFIARLMAREVEPEGTIYAQEISQQHLDYIMKEAEKEGIDNIKPVLGEHRKTNLPENSVDVIVIIRTYHHFEYPLDMLASIKGALRPEGRFIVIDRERIRGNSSEWELNHWRAGKGTFTDEIVDAGFMLEKDLPLIPGNYYLVFTHR
jgi:precorrin-6B methylase 2